MSDPLDALLPARYYVVALIGGWAVEDRFPNGAIISRHSTLTRHDTREEAEAVALALNALSK